MSNLTITLVGIAITAISACSAFAQGVPSPSTMVLSVGLQAASAPAVATQVISPPIANIAPKDLEDWRAAELADTRESYNAYLAAHPEGWFKAIAQSEIEPGISASVGSRPFANVTNRSRAQMEQIGQWEETVWQNAKQVGTHMAVRGYFARVRYGVHVQEAVNLLNQTRPKLPNGIPIDCKPDETKPNRIRNFNIQAAYPREAIAQRMEGNAAGDMVLDRTGMVIAFINPVFSNARVFERSVTIEALSARFSPLRAGCLVGQPVVPLKVQFKIR